MLVALECPTADVSAGDLGLLLDGPMPDILVDRRYEGGGSSLHLGIIGASHVATVDYGAGSFREEISCHAGNPGSLVSQQHKRYALQADTVHCPDFDHAAQNLLSRIEGEDWLLARFPGLGQFHITAVRGWATKSAWHWETHHLYPGEETIVSTASRFKL